MSKVIVTGGMGFIGTHLVDALEARGDDVVVIDDLSSSVPVIKTRETRSTLWVQDIRYIDQGVIDSQLPCGLARGPVDVVYHLAAVGSVPRSLSDPARSFDVNVNGTSRVLDLARRLGARRVVIASSSSVYGGQTCEAEEGMSTAPRSPYAASKVGSEIVAKSFAESFGMDVIVLRLFNVIGARQRADTPYSAVVPRFARALRRGEPIQLHGGGRARRDFTRVQDVAEAFVRAGEAPRLRADVQHDVINVAKGLTMSVREIFDFMVVESGRLPSSLCEPPARDGDVAYSCGRSEKLLRRLNLALTSSSVLVALREAIAHESEIADRLESVSDAW